MGFLPAPLVHTHARSPTSAAPSRTWRGEHHAWPPHALTTRNRGAKKPLWAGVGGPPGSASPACIAAEAAQPRLRDDAPELQRVEHIRLLLRLAGPAPAHRVRPLGHAPAAHDRAD